jgi:hemoglobin
MPTLYDKYGGMPTMKTLVREFYKDARINPKVGHFFSKLDMEKLIDHQVQFLSFVLGKPVRDYKIHELAKAHHPLDISDSDFDEIGRLLVKTLSKAGVALEDIKLIMGVVLEIRDEIVNRSKSPPAAPKPIGTTPTIVKQSTSSANPAVINSKSSDTSKKINPQRAADTGANRNSSAPKPSAAPSTPAPAVTTEPAVAPATITTAATEPVKTAELPLEVKQQHKKIFKSVFGGLPKIKMVVRDLYSQVNEQAELRHYFLNVTPEKIIADQEHFASYVLRKPDHFYLGGLLQSADLSIQVGADVFNDVIDILKKILKNTGLPEHDIPRLTTHIMEVIEETRTQSNDNKIGILKPVDVSAESISKLYLRNKLDTVVKRSDLVYASSSLKGGGYPFPFFTQVDNENQVLTLFAQAAAKESATSEEMGYLVNEARQYAPILNFDTDMDDMNPLFVASYSLPFEFGVPNRLLIKITKQFSKMFFETFSYDTEEILLKVAL